MLGSNGQVTSTDTHASVSYLEGFLENADSLPAELQYYVTLYKEVSCIAKETIGEISRYNDMVVKSSDIAQKKQAVHQVQRCLIKQKELGDQKLEILAMMVELVENKTRELDVDQHHPETSLLGNSNGAKEDDVNPTASQNKSSSDVAAVLGTRSSNNSNNHNSSSSNNNNNAKNEDKSEASKTKRHRRHRGSIHQDPVTQKEEEKKQQQLDEEDRPKKKKTRKDKTGEKLSSGVKIIGNIDPNEPVYCNCRQVSYGEMIGCDNENCTIEWFHFHCVSLTHKPKGKWYCPSCRGDRQNIPNPELAEQQRRAKKNTGATAGNSAD